MRKVLARLKPYYYYLVGEGIKTIEVRKNMPKASDWDNEMLFYMSKDVKSFAKIPKEFQEKYRKHFGKVGMQFVCDWIVKITPHCDIEGCVNQYIHDYPAILGENDCLSFKEMKAYLGNKNGYDWHISNLKIYDKPKELNDFCKPCKITPPICDDRCEYYSDYSGVCMNYVNRPPQSWCYVEKNEEE